MPLDRIFTSSASEALAHNAEAKKKLEDSIAAHNSAIDRAVAAVQPFLDCFESLRKIDAISYNQDDYRSNDRHRPPYKCTPGIDYILYATKTEPEPVDPRQKSKYQGPIYLDPVLAIKYGQKSDNMYKNMPFLKVCGENQRILATPSGTLGGGSNAFYDEYSFSRENDKTGPVPSILVTLSKGLYNVGIYTRIPGNKKVAYWSDNGYALEQELHGLNAIGFAETFAQWLGKVAPERRDEFIPTLLELEARLSSPQPACIPGQPKTELKAGLF